MSQDAPHISRRWVLAGLLASPSIPALAAPLTSSLIPKPRPSGSNPLSAAAVDSLIEKARLGGKVAFAVADLETGQVLENRAPLLGLPPASTTKAITALYALDALGADFRFRTQVVASGPVQDGQVQGDLILLGSGDPTLDTDRLGDMAERLKIAGVRGVTGRFLYVDGTMPALDMIDRDQPEHVGYNPSISGLNLNYNRVYFEWRRADSGYAVTMDARATRYRPEVSVARMRVVKRDLPVYTYKDGSSVDDWTVASDALGDGGGRWLPVRKPGLYAAEVFQSLARAHGVVLPNPEQSNAVSGTVIVDDASDPLAEILRGMLKYSTNLTAEVVGLMATARRTGRVPTSLKASASDMSDWLRDRAGVNHAKFVDHSGLSDQSRISAADMVRALVAASGDGVLRGLMKDIPMRDAQGQPISNYPAEVRAKTGTLNFVSTLAGYVKTQDGRNLAFATFMADEARRASIPEDMKERPTGGRAWTARARRLQLALLDRWSNIYGS